MKILVIGKDGQLSNELEAMEFTENVGMDKADLTDPEACAELIRNTECDAVINAAAYTPVDKCEEEEELAAVINGISPGAMAKACAEKNIPFVQVSTDYVFSGKGETPFLPDDVTGPLNAYGRTKLMGEEAVKAAGGPYAILRTSWVFSRHGNNFVKTILRLGKERDNLTIVADQIGGPTPARAIAHACHSMAQQLISEPEKSGAYHISGAPDCSWADFAREILRQSGLSATVTDIPTSAYPTPAVRPSNSRMNCNSLYEQFSLARPDWKQDLEQVLKHLG